MELYKELPILAFNDAAGCLAWFAQNHTSPTGIWIKIAKKGTGITTATYEDAREAAIIYGWIDGLTHRIDDTYYAIRFTPRRPKGNWSAINKKIVEQLIKEGRMHAAGMMHVDSAKKDGRWNKT
ncbi:MAG TPA: hypothetical protein VLF43_01795 [Candidatus Saccharimonadales bacterium]|nr:hypothetical protein [Candidatus Saccharimonadales bacterium]